MAVNVKAPLFMTQAALPYLSVTRGNIINTSSASANSAMPLVLTAYGMGKAAVSRLTELAAADGVKEVEKLCRLRCRIEHFQLFERSFVW